MNLKRIERKTRKFMKKNNWSEQDVNDLVDFVNKVTEGLGDTNDSLVVHKATYSGGFIVFGGWTKIFDCVIPSGTRGHELYLAFGGLGVGGWSGDCDIELITESSYTKDGTTYSIPKYHYNDSQDEFENYQTGFRYFHDNVKSFMFMYLPQFIQPIPIFVYFDSSSTRLGISVPNVSLSTGMGGGTVKVES